MYGILLYIFDTYFSGTSTQTVYVFLIKYFE